MTLNKIVLTICLFMASISSFAVKKGEILTVNGVKGIVFSVDENGEHGMMMSIKALRMDKNMFCKKSSHLKKVRQNSNTDGTMNTERLINIASAQGNSMDNFPLLQWCTNLGKGWYIPSSEELKSFINFWFGNEEEVDWDEENDALDTPDTTKTHKQQINEAMLNAGGIPFLNGVLTSTFTKDGNIVTFQYDKKKDKWRFEEISPMNAGKFTVGRAFYKF